MKINMLFYRAFLFISFLLILSRGEAQNATGYYNKGVDFYNQQQYDLAIANFSNTISLEPNNSNAYIYRGLAYYNKKDYDLAIQDYNRAININPYEKIAYQNRAQAYYNKKDYDLAFQDYNKLISLDPNEKSYYLGLGLVYYNKKDYESAIVDYSKAITISPDYTDAYYDRGLAYYSKNEYDLALQNYNMAISLSPNSANSYLARGVAYSAKKEYDLALQDYNKLISLYPNEKSYYLGLGLVYYNKKDYESAIVDYSKAITISPDYTDAYYDRGLAYYSKNEYDLALQNYNMAISLNPNSANSYLARSVVYSAKKEYDLALQDYSKSISLDPADKNAYYGRANIYQATKEYDLAILDYTKAINIDPVYTNAYNGRGIAYKFKGEYNLSINDYIKAISIDRNFSYAYINIIEPLARQYRFKDAAGYYNDFRSKNLTSYLDNYNWLFFKKYVEVITQNLIVNDYAVAINNLAEVEKLYNNKGLSSDDYQKNSFASILALKGYILEQLNRREDAKQAYEQSLLLNNLQPDITAALARLTKKQEIYVQNDNTPPVITILEPASKRSLTIEEDKATGNQQRIRGKAVDASGIKKLTINNFPLKVEEGGYFETTVDIKEGVNVFTIVALDNNANTTSETVLIETGKGKDKPQPSINSDLPVMDTNPVYYGVLIAENDYTDTGIKDLPGTVTDMRKIYKLLVENYNFSPAHTDTLVNASKVNILESLIQKANAMKENDNLFIFYAGHGQMVKHEDDSEEGFLVPADAGKNKLSSYISSDDLVRTIKYSKAKHILFVADACFAGSLFRDISSESPMPVAEAYKDKSRKLLASGNRQAVPDESEFIEYLRMALQENHTRYITAEQLIDSFKNQYKTTTHLQLQYYPIKNVDDLGGQFVFIRK